MGPKKISHMRYLQISSFFGEYHTVFRILIFDLIFKHFGVQYPRMAAAATIEGTTFMPKAEVLRTALTTLKKNVVHSCATHEFD